MKYINRIGVELEGGWEKLPDGPQMKRDGSLRQLKGLVGEINSPPSTLEEVVNFIYKFWPDFRNDTCGFHVHVSLKSSTHMGEMRTKKFFEAFQKEVAIFSQKNRMNSKWWKRYHGKNRYCKKEYNPRDKYVHINQQHYETIENRLAPGAMPKGKAIKYVQWYANFIEEYIANFEVERAKAAEENRQKIRDQIKATANQTAVWNIDNTFNTSFTSTMNHTVVYMNGSV